MGPEPRLLKQLQPAQNGGISVTGRRARQKHAGRALQGDRAIWEGDDGVTGQSRLGDNQSALFVPLDATFCNYLPLLAASSDLLIFASSFLFRLRSCALLTSPSSFPFLGS